MSLAAPMFTNHPICDSIRSSAATKACPVAKKAIFENGESDQSVARLANANFGLEACVAWVGYRRTDRREYSPTLLPLLRAPIRAPASTLPHLGSSPSPPPHTHMRLILKMRCRVLSGLTSQPFFIARSSPALYSAGEPLSSNRKGPLIFSI
jgi:hypothetical protein